MKVLLKFVYKSGPNMTRFVVTKAVSVIPGTFHYQDAVYIYTEEGKFEKRYLMGPVEETVIDEEAPGQDS